MKKLLIAITLLTFAPLSANALDFQGFFMGMNKDEIMKSATAKGKHVKCTSSCEFSTTIKGANVNSYLRLSEAGVLEIIYIKFNPSDYETLKGALVEKYGKPTDVQKELIQNQMGATFSNETASWLLKDGDVGISRYGTTVDSGSVLMFSAEYTKKDAEKKKDKASMPGF